MNTQAKQKWVAALRSGRYPQGHGALCKTDGCYCCIGVLCEVIGCPIVRYSDEAVIWFRTGNTERGTHALSEGALQRIGLDRSITTHLVYMNDREKRSFREIAAYIETHL